MCVADGEGGRRLPRLTAPDELMEELLENLAYAPLLHGPLAMTYVQSDADALAIDEAELPEWAHRRGASTEEYGRLGAQLQTNVMRLGVGAADVEDDDALHASILLPTLRLINHSCDPSCELLYDPSSARGQCFCHGGCCGEFRFTLRARRNIARTEEVSFSYLGVLASGAMTCEERRRELEHRWGFVCSCNLCTRQLQVEAAAPQSPRRLKKRLAATSCDDETTRAGHSQMHRQHQNAGPARLVRSRTVANSV